MRSATVFASVARTVTSSVDTPTNGAAGVQIVIDTTAVSGASSTVPTVSGLDPLSGKYYPLLVGSAIVATGTVVLTIFPGAVVTANLSANNFLPATFRVTMTHGTADTTTYSVSAQLLTA